jgi:hypothetical protein
VSGRGLTDRAKALAALALLASSVGCSREPSYRPVATIEQIMEGIVEPASEKVFDAAVWENGVQVNAPKSDEDWMAVRNSALAVVEAGNLLLMGSRLKDQSAWLTRTEEMMNAGQEAAKAADAKSVDAVFNAGTHLYQACTGCHLQYIRR